jgi:hypothetical protein
MKMALCPVQQSQALWTPEEIQLEVVLFKASTKMCISVFVLCLQ